MREASLLSSPLLPRASRAVGSRRAKLALRDRGWGESRQTSLMPVSAEAPPTLDPSPPLRGGREKRKTVTFYSAFAGSGCSEAALAIRAAFAIPASAAIFFCPSEPGCTTPQDMIRVAASSALISTSMILLFGT